MSTDKLTSIFVEEQFPYFLREDGAKIIDFIVRYYEAQEQDGNFTEVVKNLLNYADVDNTQGQYLEFMAREIIPNIPDRLLANKKMLMKHIQEVYKARGTPLGYKILFRALFDEEIEIYIPGEDILRVSDGRWIEEIAININKYSGVDPFDLEGNSVRGVTSGTRAIIDRIETKILNGVVAYYAYLQDVIGTFATGEVVTNIDDSLNFSISESNQGPIQEAILTSQGGVFHEVGDNISIYGVSGAAAGAIGTVVSTRSDSAVQFLVANGGAGYSVNTILNFSTPIGGSGTDATFKVKYIKGPYTPIASYDDFIVFIADVPIGGVSLTANTNFSYLIANCQFWSVNNQIALETGQPHGFVDNNPVAFYYFSGNTINVGVDSGTSYFVVNSNTTSFQVSETYSGSFLPIAQNANSNVTRASANLALANAEQTIGASLGTSLVNTGVIDTLETTNYGYGYYATRPSGQIIYSKIADQRIVDPVNGGILGFNADIDSSYAPGSIRNVRVDLQGDSYLSGDSVTLVNRTRLGTVNAIATAVASPIIQFPGKYIDTKGWLSWDKFLQDNLYYQEFSYEIQSNKSISEFDNLTATLLHPAGTKKFADMRFHIPLINQSNNFSESNEIQHWTNISNTNVWVTFSQSNTAAGDIISSNSTPFGSVLANDTIILSGSYAEDGVYIVKTVLNNSTFTVEDTGVSITLAPTKETTTGYDFIANSIVRTTGTWSVGGIGDDVFLRDTINEVNEGGPWIINFSNNTHLRVEGYDGNLTPFTSSTNDTSATVEIRRTFAFTSNNVLDLVNIKIDRFGNTYPYSNNFIL